MDYEMTNIWSLAYLIVYAALGFTADEKRQDGYEWF